MTKKADKDSEEPEVQEAPQSAEPGAEEAHEPKSLVGSGVKMVRVRVNAGVLGLAAGQTANLVETDEVKANIATGNLVIEKAS